MTMFSLNTYLGCQGFKKSFPVNPSNRMDTDWILSSKGIKVSRRLSNDNTIVTLYHNNKPIERYSSGDQIKFQKDLEKLMLGDF